MHEIMEISSMNLFRQTCQATHLRGKFSQLLQRPNQRSENYQYSTIIVSLPNKGKPLIFSILHCHLYKFLIIHYD